ATFRVDTVTVGTGEWVTVDVAFEGLSLQFRTACQQEHLSGEGGGQRRVAVPVPTDDVNERVAGTRVGDISDSMAAIVGKAAGHRVVRTNRDPLGAVHQRTASNASSGLALDHDVGLRVEVNSRGGGGVALGKAAWIGGTDDQPVFA